MWNREEILSMKRYLNIVLLTLGWSLSTAPAQDPIFVNSGVNNSQPQIDALAFLNLGQFSVSGGSFIIGDIVVDSLFIGTQLPYSMQSVRRYTNVVSARMEGSFQLDTATATGRQPAEVIHNDGYLGGQRWTLLSADKIISHGFIDSRAAGMVHLEGDDVDLSRGALRSFSGTFNFLDDGFEGDTNYLNPNGVSDLYWGVGTNGLIGQGDGIILNTATLSLPQPTSPPHEVVNSFGFTNRTIVPQLNQNEYVAYINDLLVDPTNLVRQVVFISTNTVDTNFFTSVRFLPQGSGLVDIYAEWRMRDVDVTTGEEFDTTVYFIDRTANVAGTNRFLMENIAGPTFRPSTYRISRGTPFEWDQTIDPTPLTNALDPAVITNWTYVAWSAEIASPRPTSITVVDDQVLDLPSTDPFLDPDLVPGRVEVNAKTLDLSHTRIRAENLISLRATNLVGTIPGAMDAPRFNLQVNSDQEKLLIENMIPESVKRLTGQINAWTGSWTNVVDGATVTNDTGNVSTNSTNITFYATIIDHSFNTIASVQLQKFRVSNPNEVELVDSFFTSQDFQVQTPRFRNVGNVNSAGSDANLDGSHFIGLKELVNDGSINAGNKIVFGRDVEFPFGPTNPLDSIINNGNMSASSFAVFSDEFENAGMISVNNGPFDVLATDIKLDDGTIQVLGDVIFNAAEMKAQNSSVTSQSGRLILQITDMLTDGGVEGDPNFWSAGNGIRVNPMPTEGDLLGTIIESRAGFGRLVVQEWPAEDRGAVEAGFTNNLALSSLILDGAEFSLFRFEGPGENNALYVDFLQLNNAATDINNSIEVADNFTLYYHASEPPIDPDSLSDALKGKLVQVEPPDNGTSAPGGVITASVGRTTTGAVASVSLNWNAQPGATYQIEYTDNLVEGEWIPLETVVNSESEARPLTFTEDLPEGMGQRFYRAVLANP